MLKRFLGILFLVLMFSPLIFNYLSVKHQIKSYKKAIKQKLIYDIDEKELCKLKFHIKDLKKLDWKHQREFEYQKRMFDIIKKSEIKDSIIYLCWIDKEETILNQKLNKLLVDFLNQNPVEKEKNNKTLAFYKSLYHESSDFNLKFNVLILENTFSVFQTTKYKFSFIKPIFNPPNLV